MTSSNLAILGLAPRPFPPSLDVLLLPTLNAEFEVHLISKRAQVWMSIQTQQCPSHLALHPVAFDELSLRSLLQELPITFHLQIQEQHT